MALEVKRTHMASAKQHEGSSSGSSLASYLHEINPCNLVNPEGTTDPTELWIGRGSFSVVKLQIYRGIQVAVKELLPQTMLADVHHEAVVTMKLCHPHLPYLFGVCTVQKPYRLVLHFHGIGSSAVTLLNEITQKREHVIDGKASLLLCVQLMESLRYLHDDIGILHNDLKSNNVLLTRPLSTEPLQSDTRCLHVVLIDFGKATYITDFKRLKLNGIEMAEYTKKYPHIAPEIIEGERPYSCSSDIFSAGGVVFKLCDHNCFATLSIKQRRGISDLASMCRSVHFYKRPKASKALSDFQKIFIC